MATMTATPLDLYRETGDMPRYARRYACKSSAAASVARTSVTSPIGEWALWHNSPGLPAWLQAAPVEWWSHWLAAHPEV